MLLARRRAGFSVREKADRTLLTDADLAAEQVLLDRLHAVFPDDAVLSEEAGDFGLQSGRRWIIDPLDGTTNFAQGLPFFAVSVALWEGDEPRVGVVYLPVLDEEFAAQWGAPATLNNQPIRVSPVQALSDAMVNIYFDRRNHLEAGLRLFTEVARACEGRVKVLGSTASLLCYVACGRLDGYLRNRTRLWDFAAGGLILEQAGGRVTDFDGEPLRRSGQSLLASNGTIHDALREVASGAGGDGCR